MRLDLNQTTTPTKVRVDWSVWVQNLLGRPKARSSLAILRHSAQMLPRADLRVEGGGGAVVAPRGVLDETAIGDEDEVVFCEAHPTALPVADQFDTPRHLAPAGHSPLSPLASSIAGGEPRADAG